MKRPIGESTPIAGLGTAFGEDDCARAIGATIIKIAMTNSEQTNLNRYFLLMTTTPSTIFRNKTSVHCMLVAVAARVRIRDAARGGRVSNKPALTSDRQAGRDRDQQNDLSSCPFHDFLPVRPAAAVKIHLGVPPRARRHA